jgi:hypothetical protein
MWLAVGEFSFWSVLGLMAGFALHWMRANASPYPEQVDSDDIVLRAATRPLSELLEESHKYDDYGFWEYFSLRNLKFCLWVGVSGVLGAVYFGASGHAAARDGVCHVAAKFGLVPLFCGA